MRLVMEGHAKTFPKIAPTPVLIYHHHIPDVEIGSARFDSQQVQEDMALDIIRRAAKAKGLVLWKVEWRWIDDNDPVSPYTPEEDDDVH